MISNVIFFLPFIIGLFILVRFPKDNISRFIGFLSLKSLLIFIVGILLSSFISYDDTNPFIFFIPDFVLTLIFGYFFRDLFNKDRLVGVFFVGDIVRWLSLFIEFILPDPVPEPYFYTQFYVSFFFLTIFPCIYAVGGLIVVIKRAKSQNSFY